jgi:hypothetical protein
VGGITLYFLDVDGIRALLDGLKNDSATGKKLDFLSYHTYLSVIDGKYNPLWNDPSVFLAF